MVFLLTFWRWLRCVGEMPSPQPQRSSANSRNSRTQRGPESPESRELFVGSPGVGVGDHVEPANQLQAGHLRVAGQALHQAADGLRMGNRSFGVQAHSLRTMNDAWFAGHASSQIVICLTITHGTNSDKSGHP